MTDRPASIDDVAQRAGVSTATVSRVLNSPEKVAAGTAERVREAIAHLDYRPNRFASSLMTRTSRVLGLVLPDGFVGVSIDMLRGADDEARRLGYHLLLTTQSRLADADGVRAASALGMVDGVGVMIERPAPGLMARAASLGVPVVAVAQCGAKWNTGDGGAALVRLLAQRAGERR